MYDVVIVGGGVAGLSAALLLGRGRRKVLVFDGGAPRNAPAHEAHSFFTRDGTPPLELLRIGREQLAAYDVEVRAGWVADAAREGEGFRVTAADGTEVTARRLLLATGVVDVLPEIEGLRERWGGAVFHCPYCHGWEVRGRPLAVLGRGDDAMHLVKLLRGWTDDLVLCTDGPAGLDDDARAKLARHGVALREEPVVRLEGPGGRLERIVFASGEPLAREGILLRPPQRPASDLAERLGCERLPGGPLVTDPFLQTTVPGVYVAGDGGLEERVGDQGPPGEALAPEPLGQVARGALRGAEEDAFARE
ncbi:MAG TPA: NAD(P)/FAD-dependent oxidoreductase, partial [Longimicrobium sp.]|nr:NAD(P)/FAD-dependent oxidoreductase [Longimicrobium sp.]